MFVVCTYFVDIDVDMDSAVEQLRRFYDVSERKTASTFQGGIYYYELTLKNKMLYDKIGVWYNITLLIK